MINIEAISKCNLIKDPFEHLLIDFIDKEYVKNIYKEYIKNLERFNVCEYTNIVSVSEHPVKPLCKKYEKQILFKINELWDLNVVSIDMGITMFDKNSELDTHNDYNYDGNFSIPVRGILYLNDEKVFGTKLHRSENDLGFEVGGFPGQLLLFKVSENSWHSAGIDTSKDERIVCNWIVNNEYSNYERA